jgi:hypothetical protein
LTPFTDLFGGLDVGFTGGFVPGTAAAVDKALLVCLLFLPSVLAIARHDQARSVARNFANSPED